MEQQTGTKKAITADQLAELYVKLRDRRAARKKQFEAEDAKDAERMVRLEAAMKKMCQELNVNSMNTNHGTIIRRINERYWTSDWDSFYKLVLDQQLPQLLERRIAQKSMKEFLGDHPELMPPGLNIDREYAVTVMRGKKGNEEE